MFTFRVPGSKTVIGAIASAAAAILMAGPAYAGTTTWNSVSNENQYLAVKDYSLLNGGHVVSFEGTALTGANGYWYVSALSNGAYNLLAGPSAASRNTPFECMEDSGYKANVYVDQWDCAYGNQANEQFIISDVSDLTHRNWYTLTNQGNGQCVTYTGINVEAYYTSICNSSTSSTAKWHQNLVN